MIRILLILVLSSLLFTLNSQERHPAFSERKEERRIMVYRDIAQYNGIKVTDTAVLGAMFRVPRHAFVPEELHMAAYRNSPLPIGYDQTISQPVIVASMTQLLDCSPGSKILEIGTGSGYQAAVLAELGCEVYSIEIVEPLGQRATEVLKKLHYTQVRTRIGDGYAGWKEYAPYQGIIVTCAPEKVPQALVDQLAPGGRIVIPVGPVNSIQFLTVLRKTKKGKLIEELIYPVRFVPMTGRPEFQE